MLKILYVLLVSFTLLHSSDKVEIFATDIHSEGEILYADGAVNVVYKDYYLSASRAKYDKTNGVLELYENVRVTKDGSYKILGEYARVNLQNKQKEFKPFYMSDSKSKVWMSAANAKTNDNYINVEGGIVSGCNPNEPLWKMEFSSSDYNDETKWLNTYNNRLYMYDVLIFYTPYFGYSLDRKRRTGLLYPSIGLSSDEGFYYEQPIFIAEQNWWDLEIKPQIRTQRGHGIYSNLRFIDSKVSQGSLSAGWFKEDDKYLEEYNLQNKKHFGFDFNYVNRDLLNQWFGLKNDGQSEIYLDLLYMNDVDYIYLSTNDTTTNATAPQTISRVNLFYNDEDNYIGSYVKYYQDLAVDDNSKTPQQLPTLHLHHYLETFFDNHFMYNIDVKGTNIYRDEGVGVVQTDINIPLTLQTSLFDEYLNVAYKTFFYSQSSNFTGLDEITNKDDYKDGHYAKNYSVVQVNTSLTKAFTDYTHVVNFGTKYSIAGLKNMNGYYEDNEDECSNSKNGLCEFYSIRDSSRDLNVEFTQFLFDKSGSQKLYHKLSQNIIYKDDYKDENLTSDKQFGELENELRYQLTSSLDFYNNTFYNHDEKDFSKIYNQVAFNANGLNLSLAYLYQNKFHKEGEASSGEPFAKYLTSSASYRYDSHYSYNIVYNYDIQTNLKKNLEVGFLYQKRCWDFGLRYVENNRPIGYNSIYDRYVYFTILLKPFMQPRVGSGLSYKLPETLKRN
jgi:LPS-assembly protein